MLQDEHYTSKTCPNCGNRHKPKGRIFKCPACKFQSHRDVVGQINILSAYKFGEPGKLAVPTQVKYRIPLDLRVMRKCRDTGQGKFPVAREGNLPRSRWTLDHAEYHDLIKKIEEALELIRNSEINEG